MSKLVFKSSDVKRVVEHAIKTEGEILLVHDQGVYLMSSGKPHDKVNENSNFVVYVQGCNSETDADWYDTARNLVGGDDFGESMPFAEAIKEMIDNGAEEIIFSITPENIQLEKPKVTNLR